jgi:serine/threonine protein kinase
MKSKLNNKIYTVKKLPVKKELPKELIRETTFLLKSNNEYIVKLYGYFQGIEKIEKLKNIYKNNKDKLYQNEKEDKKMYFLIMEYVSDDSLDDYLKKCRSNNQIVPQDFIIKILKQLLSVLDYLYSNSIMHRDIKLNTILLDQNNNIKIRDFGRSALHRDNIEDKDAENNLLSNSTRVGRTDFVAPEILMGMEFDYKIDIFSLGLTMLCLVSKKHPIFLIGGKRSINMDLIDTNIYNEYLINLIKIMISENPLKRPSAREALYGLINIENYIKDPSEINEKKLNEIMLQENILFLQGIGTKPEDFESIKSKDKEYTILGHGNFGFAEKMRSKLNNKLYAIKRLPVKKDISQDFIRETNIMIQLNNKNVIKFYGYFQGYEKIEKLKYIYKTNENDKNSPYQGEKDDKKMYFLVLDFASNGSLKDYYEKYMKEKKPIEQEFIIKILFQLLSGLRYLHSVKIMHRDIKMDNILLD